jgi:hypothetical protein
MRAGVRIVKKRKDNERGRRYDQRCRDAASRQNPNNLPHTMVGAHFACGASTVQPLTDAKSNYFGLFAAPGSVRKRIRIFFMKRSQIFQGFQ